MYSTSDIRICGSRIHGLGVFSVRAIPARTRVLEYVGTCLTAEEYAAQRDKTFCFELGDGTALDGGAGWNPAGFLNHSCEPNCESVVGTGTVWIETRHDIAAGEELTFNYGYAFEKHRKNPCRCGAKGCVGYIVAERFFPLLRELRDNGELSP